MYFCHNLNFLNNVHSCFLSNTSQPCGTLSPLVLGASSPLLRKCLEEGGDVIVLPDFSATSLALLATCLLHPLSFLDTPHVEVLEDLVNLIGIPLPALLPSSDNDKICNEEDNSCGSIIARTADNYSETDTNGNHGTGDENTNFRNENNTNINTWASNNNPEGTEKEKLNSLFCSLCRTPCYDTAAMELHLAQHCEVQVE